MTTPETFMGKPIIMLPPELIQAGVTMEECRAIIEATDPEYPRIWLPEPEPEPIDTPSAARCRGCGAISTIAAKPDVLSWIMREDGWRQPNWTCGRKHWLCAECLQTVQHVCLECGNGEEYC
jgi:hypothetical protein